MVAGVSVDYYTRLERGNLSGVSEGVLEALARGLQLDDAERDHLFDLARTANSSPGARQRAPRQAVRPSVAFMLEAITGAPAFVRNIRMDVLAANPLGYALYSPMYDGAPRLAPDGTARPANHSRFIFLDPRAREFYPDWGLAANNNVALLRTESGRNPYDKGLADLVGELTTRSDEFAALWARHNVRRHYSGNKHFHHPVVGDLELLFEALALAEDPGLTLTVYPVVPGSPSEESLRLLASWAATERIAERALGAVRG
jgi:transcriptional regulator with XRE-family HTH domain